MLSQLCQSCSCVISCHVFMKLFYEQINKTNKNDDDDDDDDDDEMS